MVNPQLENGHIEIANEIWDHLCRTRIPGVERQILDVIIRKTYGWKKKKDMISISQFQEMTGLKKPHVVRAVDGLLSKKIISITKNDNKIAHEYEFNKNYEQWVSLPKKVTLPKKVMCVTNNDNKLLPLLGTTKETITKETITKETKYSAEIPFIEIIEYLNALAGTKYKSSTKTTKQHINARWNEGFRFIDFKTVIDKKVSEWIDDPNYSKYIRPETLFGTKFEGYLNAPIANNKKYSEITKRNIESFKQWVPPEERANNG